MYTQTVFKTGNSYAITIPKDILKELAIRKGQKVLVEKSPEGEAVIVRKATPRSKKTVMSAEFRNWLKAVLKEDAQILDELAVR